MNGKSTITGLRVCEGSLVRHEGMQKEIKTRILFGFEAKSSGSAVVSKNEGIEHLDYRSLGM